MSATTLRSCFVAAALAVLSGCASADVDSEGKEEARKTEKAPDSQPQPESATGPAADQEAGPTTDRPTGQVAGLGTGGLLGPMSGPGEPKPNAAAVKGRVFNGAYTVELGAADRRRAREAIHAALEWLPAGRLKVWRNPDNGHWGTVTAMRTYQNAEGLWCREYHQTVTIGGDENQDNGAACRNAGGVWQPRDG